MTTGMKKQRHSQHGGKTRAAAANPAISQHTDTNEDFGSPIPSSMARSFSTFALVASGTEAIGSSGTPVTVTFDHPETRETLNKA